MLASSCTVVVEGHEIDPFYYSTILAPIENETGYTIRVRSSREIEGSGGGKLRCLGYFNYLVSSERLQSSLAGISHVTLFILDKDIDDVLGKQVENPHVCYTTFHSVENHVVRESKVRTSLAAVASVDPRSVKAHMPDTTRWLLNCAKQWREWLITCVAAQLAGEGTKGFSRLSAFNHPADAPCDSAIVADERDRIVGQNGLSPEREIAVFREAEAVVDQHLGSGDWDKIFKGKWYAQFAKVFMERSLGIQVFNERAFWSSLLTGLEVNSQSSQKFRDAVATIIQQSADQRSRK